MSAYHRAMQARIPARPAPIDQIDAWQPGAYRQNYAPPPARSRRSMRRAVLVSALLIAVAAAWTGVLVQLPGAHAKPVPQAGCVQAAELPALGTVTR